jgi:hypothetical protein
LFLSAKRGALIPWLQYPIAVATFAVMYLFGYCPRQPLPNGADDFDRFRGGRCDRGDEDISRHLEEGASPLRGLQGHEIGFTVFHQHLADVSIPILMMAGTW